MAPYSPSAEQCLTRIRLAERLSTSRITCLPHCEMRARLALAEVMEQEYPADWSETWGEKLEEIRHNYVAHFNFDKQMNPTKEDIKRRSLTLANLEVVQERVAGLFDILALGMKFMAMPLKYHPRVSMGGHARTKRAT